METAKNILVIEDTPAVRELLCQLLENSGFHVRGCDDGVNALHAAEEDEFHVIITDYDMPRMNGVDATRCLRSRFPASTIIGVSSSDKGRDFLAAGADAFLLKPFRYSDLMAAMNVRD